MSASDKLQAPTRPNSRIDIAVNERGASAVTLAINKLADACQKLSPALAKSLRGEALRVGVSTDAKVKEVASAILETVVKATPHDTGRARANWVTVVRISRPHSTPLWEQYDYDGDDTIAEGKATIENTKRAPGQTIYISNALPYIEALNNGWSKQAPANFVELAVQAGSVAGRTGKKAFDV